MVMEWLGHQDSEMVRLYYHLHDDELAAAWRLWISLVVPAGGPPEKPSNC